MRAAQRISQLFGWAFVLVGLSGFAATGGSMDPSYITAPHLFGLFPVNVVHNCVHLVFGAWGLLAARGMGGSRTFLLGAGLVYLVLAALGVVLPDGLGLVPLGGNDVGLHLFLGLGLLLSGMITGREPVTKAAV